MQHSSIRGSTNGSTNGSTALTLTRAGTPRATIHNLCTILDTHVDWQGRLWHDVARDTPMIDDQPVREDHIIAACLWLSAVMDMHLTSSTLMERCLTYACRQHPKDLLREQLDALPPWDGVPRLENWLSRVAGAPFDAYGKAVSRILPVSMVARALNPGCLYRYVVILEGPEGSGKTSLVRALSGEEWYTELTKGLDSKEVYMLIQGAWVAEMAELDSLNRTEKARLKAFVTTKADQWIPKYSNLKVTVPRRTILIGTTNDKSYLNGESGNTRFLPIATGAKIRLDAFALLRDQLFAQALHVYHEAPATWWQFPDDAMRQAVEEREARRVENVYEQALGDWLNGTGACTNPESPLYRKPPAANDETTWEEIAEKFLCLDQAAWEQKTRQMQIAEALKACGWESHNDRKSAKAPGVKRRYWQRRAGTT